MTLPEYKLLGSPRKVKTHKQWSSNYYQYYRLLDSPKKLRAPCAVDKQVSSRKAIHFVEQHIKKALAKTDSIIACAGATIEQHLAVYRQSLEADDRCPKHINGTIRLLGRTCAALGWTLVPQVDGLKLKHWLSQQKMSVRTRKYYGSAFRSFTKFLAENRRIETDPLIYYKPRQKGDDPKPTRIRRGLLRLN